MLKLLAHLFDLLVSSRREIGVVNSNVMYEFLHLVPCQLLRLVRSLAQTVDLLDLITGTGECFISQAVGLLRCTGQL